MAREANFDGLVGPTHNYAGLSFGNRASQSNEGDVAQPRAAALQGLDKMWSLAQLGLVQGVLPPHERPHLPTLRSLGFSGTDEAVVECAAQEDPTLLANASSASAMWTANAATVSPSADTADGKVHFSVANLTAKLHRSIEGDATTRTLRATFSDAGRFCVHSPLPPHPDLGDEGAANHTRLAPTYGAHGVEIFVFGRSIGDGGVAPTRYPARQTLEASQAIARRHGLHRAQTIFAQQSPQAIDAGVFHNDVISVGNLDVLFYHERAYLDSDALLSACERALDGGLRTLRVPEDEVPLDDAVRSYLFNTQLVETPNGQTVLIAPTECQETRSVHEFLTRTCGAGIIDQVRYFELRQSMRNGGGPACLRLRVVLTAEELGAVNSRSILDSGRYAALRDCVERNYRETLAMDELGDPALLRESRTALDEFTQILGLPSLYEFQRERTG
jgi:succinylarginine dihydrolase